MQLPGPGLAPLWRNVESHDTPQQQSGASRCNHPFGGLSKRQVANHGKQKGRPGKQQAQRGEAQDEQPQCSAVIIDGFLVLVHKAPRDVRLDSPTGRTAPT
jgi:hypothetical protein